MMLKLIERVPRPFAEKLTGYRNIEIIVRLERRSGHTHILATCSINKISDTPLKELPGSRHNIDGSSICLHPNYANTHVAAKHNEPQADVQLPDSGMGGTSGPGTFKHFAMKAVDITLRFDAQKNRSRGKNYWPRPSLPAPPLPPHKLRLGPHVPPPPILDHNA